MNWLHNQPKAPRRFQVIDENTWVGSPSVPYGSVRRLAYEQRKRQDEPYVRVLFGEAGRRGDPWGGLALEVNGEYFHFTAGVKRWPHLHDGAGNLTNEGQRALARGVPGYLSTSCDWRWIQDEVDLTSKFTTIAIKQIAEYFRSLRDGQLRLPMFQSRMWAKRWNAKLRPGYHNCTTIIMEQIRLASGLIVTRNMPLPAFDILYYQMVVDPLFDAPRSKLDDELNHFLSQPEQGVGDLLKDVARGKKSSSIDWNEFAKGLSPLPDWLTWDSLPMYVDWWWQKYGEKLLE